jgi:two-component system, cell cycle sensor histidine kinase and response regulator CckA
MKRKLTAKNAAVEPERSADPVLKERQSGFFSKQKANAPGAQRLVRELQVQQIELELQNEELQRARAEVEDGLAHYSSLCGFAPVGYLALNRDGVIRRVNLFAACLLGQERSWLVGKRFCHLVAAESGLILDAFLASVLERRTQQTCEVLVGPKSLVVELTGNVMVEDQYSRIVMTDITARRQAEQERAELQAQLAQSRKMEAIGTFAAGIAHDFNNILGGILGGLSLLELKNGHDCAYHEDIVAMQAMVKRGAELIKQLLGFTRRGGSAICPVNLASVVAESSDLFARTRKDIRVELELASDLQAVVMDYTQFEQVMLNLLANAGHAMQMGGRLLIRAENVVLSNGQASAHDVERGHFVKLVVRDTGVGMDSATKERIFEPFFTTRAAGEGTGLGLASVYGIVKNHGGFIKVESELGEGTAFTIMLPGTDCEVSSQVCPVKFHHGTGTVLMVDDEEQLVKVYTRVLEKIGYKTLTASGGRQAIDLVRQYGNEISLVILDMVMPDMNGCQTYDEIQKVAPGLKVLLATGLVSGGQAEEMMAHGCNGFIEKPFDAATLSAKVQEVI